ncbi:UDP-2,3-diacylglucosamine diphosphatase [Gluconacetobacter asukensis]|uniref:UDP-2,3-diacylglucosamine diphosphatase n=1 Tax=Gluconacetobacter asukensis TaxID=1017181 RepID=A0A7W4J2K1_9PROT|nr:UDP-2,3-diacylglucosamine diphosphatase [Gluconacetobacter asukensis]MBB2173511.1 UDP-2,3-diacylglucosamine diphosphatase [Gluconacetobacter asukensis]
MNVILNDRLASASYRAVFVSDVHLGTRDCRADLLAEFLRNLTCQRLYLVGDIIDGWKLKRSWFWNSHHDDVLNLILRMGRSGTEIIYIPGNHDEMFRRWLPHELEVAGIRLCGEAEHVTATGRKFLVLHGDEFDSVVRYAPFLAMLGDRAYTLALVVNRWFNLARRRLGLPYRSLSQWLKRQVKSAVMAIDRFETAVADEARRRGMDGVICGHIHHAVIKDLDGVLYMNDGDWVESCSALVEHHDGSMELLDVTDVRNRFPAPAPLASPLFAAGA